MSRHQTEQAECSFCQRVHQTWVEIKRRTDRVFLRLCPDCAQKSVAELVGAGELKRRQVMKVDLRQCDLCGKKAEEPLEGWRNLCEAVGEDFDAVEWDICPDCQNKPISALVVSENGKGE